MTTVQLGNTIRLLGSFIYNGAAYDPVTVTLNVKAPNGVQIVSTTSVTRTATGMYYYDYIPPVSDIFKYQFLGSGNNISSEGNSSFLCASNGH